MLCASSWCFPVQSCDKCCQLANCRVSVSEGPGTPKRPSVERAACLGGTHASHHTRIHERNPKFPPSRSLRAETNYGSTRRQRQGNDRVLNLQDPKLPPKVWQESVVLNLVFSVSTDSMHSFDNNSSSYFHTTLLRLYVEQRDGKWLSVGIRPPRRPGVFS